MHVNIRAVVSLCYIIIDMEQNLNADKSSLQEIEDIRRDGDKKERIQSNAHMSIFLMHVSLRYVQNTKRKYDNYTNERPA